MALALSLVVVAYDMARELPRTLRSLAVPFQRTIAPESYEVIVVDNGSRTPFDRAACRPPGLAVTFIDLDGTSPSPAAAVNTGVRAARSGVVGVMVDGARLASPGLLAQAMAALRIHDRAVVATVAHHLGPDMQMRAVRAGYTQAEEDRLLAAVSWEEDGYRLFDVSSFDGSSRDGVFGQLHETNALFMRRALWDELGGMDERFALPGGGLANLDLFRRAVALADSRLIVLLGEATFHQLHGGASTNAGTSQWRGFAEEYARIKGEPYQAPPLEPLYFGSVPQPARAPLAHAARIAHLRTLPRPVPMQDGWSATALSEPLLSGIETGREQTRYRGLPLDISPFDLALFLQVIGRLRPRSVIVAGAKETGSLLWLTDALSAHDIARPRLLSAGGGRHEGLDDPRVTVLSGGPPSFARALTPQHLSSLDRPWLVVIAGPRRAEEMLAAMRLVHGQLAAGDMLVVEGGVVQSLAHHRFARFENGPTRAVEVLLAEHPGCYEIDRSLCDLYGVNVTWSPNGWLRRT